MRAYFGDIDQGVNGGVTPGHWAAKKSNTSGSGVTYARGGGGTAALSR